MAAEDYTGQHRTSSARARRRTGVPSYYTQALTDAGIPVRRLRRRRRTAARAPDPLGVLSHYKASSGTRATTSTCASRASRGGTGNSKLMDDEVIAVRDYLNDGGTVLVTGQQALQGAWTSSSTTRWAPRRTRSASPTTRRARATWTTRSARSTNCIIVSNDFVQYYLGAWIASIAADRATTSATLPFKGVGGPFGTTRVHAQRRRLGRQPGARADVRDDVEHPAGERVPAVRVDQAIGFDRPPAYRPAGGHAVRLRRIQRRGLPAAAPHDRPDRRHHGDLKFKVSYDTEQDYDYVFVEAHTVGQDDWTTLPDTNGHTSDDVGASCDIDWNTMHPFLNHYQTNPTSAEDCTNTGTTGKWNGATGNSSGFQDWNIDLSAYKGKQVEVSITYAQDFAVSGLGVFLDEVQILKDGAVAESTGLRVRPRPVGRRPAAGRHRERRGVGRPRPRRLQGGPGHRDRGHPAVGLRPRGRLHAGRAVGGAEGRADLPAALASGDAAGVGPAARDVRDERRRRRRRQRARHAVADARAGGAVRRVHPGCRRRRTSRRPPPT